MDKGKLFKEIVDENWVLLGFDKQPSLPQFEAFLIDFISRFTKTTEIATEPPKKADVQKRDALLLMFGLLDGYYHTGNLGTDKDNVPIPAKVRLAKYIKKSDYIKIKHPGKKYEEIKTTAERTVYKVFRRAFEENKNCTDFFSLLYKEIKKGMPKKYTSKSPETITFPNGERRIALPKPCFIRNGQEDINCWLKKVFWFIADKFNALYLDAKNSPKRMLKKVWIIFALTLVIWKIFQPSIFLFIEEHSSSKVSSTIDGIGVANPEPITLKPNEREKLLISLSPENSDIGELSCIPDDPNIVYIEREKNNVYVKANEELNDNKKHTTTITIQGGKAKEVVWEVVVQPNENKDDSATPRRELEGDQINNKQ